MSVFYDIRCPNCDRTLAQDHYWQTKTLVPATKHEDGSMTYQCPCGHLVSTPSLLPIEP